MPQLIFKPSEVIIFALCLGILQVVVTETAVTQTAID